MTREDCGGDSRGEEDVSRTAPDRVQGGDDVTRTAPDGVQGGDDVGTEDFVEGEVGASGLVGMAGGQVEGS